MFSRLDFGDLCKSRLKILIFLPLNIKKWPVYLSHRNIIFSKGVFFSL